MHHEVAEVTLDNGAQGLLLRIPGVDVTRILVEFRAGFDLHSWDKYELPHVMEHLMFTNEDYPHPRQFSREIERNGAFNNAYTSPTSLEYDYECASFEAPRIAELVASQIAKPLYVEEELKTEIGNVAEELNTNLSNPGHTALYNLHVAATGTPSLQTRIDQLSSITTDDLYAHYRQTHTARNMRFIIAGDRDFDELLSILEDAPLTPGEERLELPPVLAQPVSDPVVETRDIPQIYYSVFSALDNRLSYRELIAARVLTAFLSDGFSSTLFGAARERGLAYGLSMRIGEDPHETNFVFSGPVSPEHAEDYFRLAKDEISKVLAGEIDAEHFEATKTLLRGKKARGYQKLSDLVGYYDSFFTVGYEPFERYNQLLDEISREEAVEAFSTLLKTGCWGVSFTGNIDEQKARKFQRVLSPLFD